MADRILNARYPPVPRTVTNSRPQLFSVAADENYASGAASGSSRWDLWPLALNVSKSFVWVNSHD